MDDQEQLTSLDQVESKILSLYQGNPPDVIAAAQASLLRFQSSPQAWPMVHTLLERADEKVRFFGALTVIIKLNKESFSLSDADANELLVRLVGWYLDALSQPNGPLVLRKLSSALATHFIHFHRLWPHYLRHLIVCLASGLSHIPNAIDDTVDTASILSNLQPGQLQAALWVVTSVMEDVSRIDLNTNKVLYDAILQTTMDAVALMRKGTSAPNNAPAIHSDSTRCLQSWVMFAQRASFVDSPTLEPLKSLIEAIIASLSVETLFNDSVELLVDILTNCPSLLTREHYESMASLFESPWAQERYRRLLQGDFEVESMQFGQLLLTFGEIKAEALIQSSDETSQRFLAMLGGLLATEGFPVVQDKIFVSAVEFWSTFTEILADTVRFDQDESSPWASSAMGHTLEAVSRAWRKVIYPPSEDFNQWDSSERVGFNDARKDVVDLLQSAYAVIGPRLVMNFANLTLSTLASSAWRPLEAAIFCLGGLADCAREDPDFDKALASVFASPLFCILQAPDSHVHLRTRQTCLSLIEQYTDFFERNTVFLAPALRLLFSMLRENSMTTSASKSILRLCSSCRHHLYTETEAFLDEYQYMASQKRLDCLSNERILGAIACIVQAAPDIQYRFVSCARILEIIERDFELAQELAASSTISSIPCQDLHCFGSLVDEPPALHIGLRALRCLVNVGKGFQSPSETVINLDADNCRPHAISDSLLLLHQTIMSLVSRLEGTFVGCPEVTELVCSLLRCGFSEDAPGPFVLFPETIAQFLTSHTGDSPRIGLYVSAGCSLVSSMYSYECPDRHEIVATLLAWVTGLLEHMREPELDPELAQNGVEFATRVMAKSPATVLGLQPMDAAEFLFIFTIRVLDGKEPLPKSAAADFWTTFVGLKGDSPESQDAIKRALEALGPLLTQSLARNIGGNASRSELDKLSEPVKKLVGRHPKAKEWLQSGLSHPSFPSNKVDLEQKTLFVKKLISLRGSRATNQVIREFWLSARGSNFAYIS